MSDTEDNTEMDFNEKLEFEDNLDNDIDEEALLNDEAEDLLEVKEIKFIGYDPKHFCDNFYFLYSPCDFIIKSKESKKIDTLIKIEFEDCFAEMFSSSNLARKNIMYCGSGLIDTNYRGPLIACLTNNSKIDQAITKDTVIAVLHLQQRSYADVVQSKTAHVKTSKKDKYKKAKKRSIDGQKRKANTSDPIEIDEYITMSKQQKQQTNATQTNVEAVNVNTQTNVEPIPSIFWEQCAPTSGSLVLANEGDAAYDVQIGDLIPPSICIHPGERKQINTGIKLKLPTGWHGQILSRSGLSYKHGINIIGGGRIPSNFRRSLSILLQNTSDRPFYVKPGFRIAQIVFKKDKKFKLIRLHNENDFNRQTVRGEGGFGSTGYY